MVTKHINQIIGLGILAGIRTSFAPALLSQHFHQHPSAALGDSRLNLLQSEKAAVITKLFAAFEIVGDKNPLAPNRTGMPQVLFRIASGAFAGFVLAKAKRQHTGLGLLVGAASAVAGTFGAFYLRQYIDRLPGVKDVYVGAAEDLVGIAAGGLISSGMRQ